MVGGCLLCAIFHWARHPLSTKIHTTRNRAGRLHWFWSRNGVRYHFHAPGRSGKTYLQNLLYRGVVVEMGKEKPRRSGV